MPSGPLGYWPLFIVIAAVIAVAGPHVSRKGDIIAEGTGMTGSWVGIVLIATVTSLPELTTGSSAFLLWDLPDIAVGDVMGSCVSNLMILMVVDFMLRGASVYPRAEAMDWNRTIVETLLVAVNLPLQSPLSGWAR